jgi:hypothetical protein
VGGKRERRFSVVAHREQKRTELLSYYYLDESDPDILMLCRQDESYVAAFSARGATREGIVEAAREDYRGLLEANAESLGHRESGDRQRSA